MATVEQRLVFVISAKDENVSRIIAGVKRAMEDAAEQSKSAGEKLRGALSGLFGGVKSAADGARDSLLSLKTGAAALAGGAGLGAVARRSLEFTKGMADIGTITANADKDVKRLSASVRDTALAFGQTQASSVKAQYDIISGGFQGAAEASEVFRVSAKLAVAGASEVGPTANLLTNTLKGFGLGAEEAQHAADVLFKTVQYGITTVPELAQSFGLVAPAARLAGVDMEEAAAALASLTAAGIKTPEAVVALSNVLDRLGAPLGEAEANFEKLGVRITKIGPDGRKSLIPLIEIVEQFRGLDLETIRAFFPDVQAVRGMGALASNFDEFARNYAEFTDRSKTEGTLDKAFGIAADNAAFSVERLKTLVGDLAIEMGQGFQDELGGGAEAALARVEELRAGARRLGQDVGEALRVSVGFVQEWRDELLAVAAAYALIRAAAVAMALVQGIQEAIKLTQAAAAAARAWAAELYKAGLASNAAKAGVAGLALAVGLLIAVPLGNWIGEAVSGASELRREVDALSESARAAGKAFEEEFARKAGASFSEAQRRVAEGGAVLEQQLEAYDRATGKAIDGTEKLTQAGVGTRVLSANLIDVASAAQKAAEETAGAGDQVQGLTDAQRRLAEAAGASGRVVASLPEAVTGAFVAANAEAEEARKGLSKFRREAEDAQQQLDFNRRTGKDTEELSRRMSFLMSAIASQEEAISAARSRAAGIAASVKKGEEAAGKAAADRAEADALRDRQLKMRRELEDGEETKQREQAAKRLASLRERAVDEFQKSTMRETAFLREQLLDRLEEVKGYEASAAAVAARNAVASTARSKIQGAGEDQVKAAAQRAADAVELSLQPVRDAVSAAAQDGFGLADQIPSVSRAVDDAAARFGVLRAAAVREAEAAKADLQRTVQDLGDALVRSGQATQEEVDRVLSDPLGVQDLPAALGDLADAAVDASVRASKIDEALGKGLAAAGRDASSAVRELVSGLGDLTVEQMRYVRSQLSASDAAEVAAARFLDARIAAGELERAQAGLAAKGAALTRELSSGDLGRRSFLRLREAVSAVSDELPALRELDRTLGRVSSSAELAGASAEELRDALRGAAGGLGDAGLSQLLRARRQASSLSKELSAAGLGEAAAAAQELFRAAGKELSSRLRSAAAGFAMAIGKAVVSAASAAVSVVRSVLEMAMDPDAVEAFVERLSAELPAAAEALAENVGVIVDAFSAALPKLVAAVAAEIPDVVDALVSGARSAVQAVAAALPEIVPAILDGLVELVRGLSNALKEMAPELGRIIGDVLSGLGDAVGEILKSSTSALGPVITALVDALVAAVPDIVGGIVSALPKVISNLGDAVVSLVEGIVRLLKEMLPELLQELLGGLPDVITSLLSAAGDIVDALLTELLPAIPDIVLGILDAVLGNLPEIVVALVEGVIELLPRIVVALFQGIIELLPRLFVLLAVQLPALVIQMVAEIISSLPRIAAGLAEGFFDFLRHPFRTLGDLFGDAFASSFRDAWADAASAIQDAWGALSGLWSSVTSFFGGLRDWFEDALGWLIDAVGGKSSSKGSSGKKDGVVKTVAKTVVKTAKKAYNTVKGWLGFRWGGTVPRPRYRALFGATIPGMGDAAQMVMAHAGEGFLRRPAVRFVGGAAGVSQLNRGIVPDELRRRDAPRAPAAPAVVNFVGGAVFARDASSVVDEITSRAYADGSGRTARMLQRRYGTMPGQRR